MQSITTDQFREWSHRLQRSDRDAYAEVFRATYDALFRYAWRYTRDDEAAYDVLQETYMKLWLIREEVDPDRSLKALLYHMVRNFALNQQRYRKRHATDSLDEQLVEPGRDETIEADLDASDLNHRLQDWIKNLPPRRREAFMLSRYEGLSHEEIARVMGLTPKTVNNHIVLALQHLRELMRTRESDPLST